MAQPASQRMYGGRYRAAESVGSGGMATVYRGVDTVLDREVAIKVMHPHLAARDDARARFRREAKAIARLKHPNIVDVYDFSTDDDEEAYLVTEFVHGMTLTEFANRHGPLLPQAAALIGHAVAGAMTHAHTAGLIHRDIKPDNLMISRKGEIKLMDFGIATAMDMEQMTATGAILGSPAHMAPEQIEGAAIDHRVDVFAYGTVLYFLVTGRLPFVASNPHALFRLILECAYDPPSRHNPSIDREFEEIIATAMARSPEERWSSMAAIQAALGRYLQHFGLDEVPTLLPALLTRPEQEMQSYKPKIVQVLCDDGRAHALGGALALAIDAYNRALAIDPDAEAPRAGLSELTSRSRRRRRLRAASIAVGGALVAGVALWWLQRPPAAPAASALAAPTIAVAARPPPGPDTDRLIAAEARAQLDDQRRQEEQRRLIEAAARRAAEEVARARAPAEPAPDAGPLAAPPGVEGAAGVRTARAGRVGRAPSGTEPVPTPIGAGPKMVAPPDPREGLIEVTLGSLPPISVLYLDGELVSRTGYRRISLVSGRTYTLRCEPHAESCPLCPESQERPFRVPDRPPSDGSVFSVKCDFRAFTQSP